MIRAHLGPQPRGPGDQQSDKGGLSNLQGRGGEQVTVSAN